MFHFFSFCPPVAPVVPIFCKVTFAYEFILGFVSKTRRNHGSRTPENPIPGQGSGKTGQDEEAAGSLGHWPKEGCPGGPQGNVCRLQGKEHKWLHTKLRRLGVWNWIADDLDSKLSKFGQRFNDELDFSD